MVWLCSATQERSTAILAAPSRPEAFAIIGGEEQGGRVGQVDKCRAEAGRNEELRSAKKRGGRSRRVVFPKSRWRGNDSCR